MRENYNEVIDDLVELDIMEEEGESKSLPSIRLILDGVATEEELSFIRSKATSDGVNQIPFYVKFGLDSAYVCDVDLTIDLLLNLRFIGSNKYTLVLVNGDRQLEIIRPNIDEDSITMLLNFVRIGGLE